MKKENQELITLMKNILLLENPQTVRQVYYQLVSRQVLPNCQAAYKKVSSVLSDARLKGMIPWPYIEDRTRKPHVVSMWNSLIDFSEDVFSAYKKDIWATQPQYVEAWLEKDALSGVFKAALQPYRVTLNVGKGFDGWSSMYTAAERYKSINHKPVTILYFGDLDPSGEAMITSLKTRLEQLGTRPNIIKCALTLSDVQTFNLPVDPIKKSDTRAAKYRSKFGDISVELDALPMSVLRAKICTAVEEHMDMDALQKIKDIEQGELNHLKQKLEGL